MAFQTKGRDPLFDSDMQAAIEKRGVELIGISLIVLGVLFTLILWSYSPDDPSWMVATAEPAQNTLGRFGATIAQPLMIIVGLGSWAIPVILIAWGSRFCAHRGTERALGRLVFAPIAVAALSVYAATVPTGDGWTHSSGYGGLFGDTALAMLMTFLPLGESLAVKLLAFLSAIGLVAFGAFVLGCDRDELRSVQRFLLLGVIALYVGLLKAFGFTLRKSAEGANAGYAAMQARREARAEARAAKTAQFVAKERPGTVIRAPIDGLEDEPAPSSDGFLSKLTGLLSRRSSQPEPHGEPIEIAPFDDQHSDERIKARINDAIRHRVRPPMTASPVERATAGRGGPQPLIAQPGPGMQMPKEPPLTAPVLPAAPPLEAETLFDQPVPEAAPLRAAQTEPAMQSRVVQPQPKAAAPSRQAKAEAQPSLPLEKKPQLAYEYPPLGLLRSPDTVSRHHLPDEALEQNARMLETVLEDYGVKGDIVSVRPGPVVTMYELEPAPGLKASRVIGLADDIARSMSALSARVSTVPGRSVIGIELPNEHREMVVLREILANRDFGDSNMRLPLALGKDIGGDAVVANLAKMPHLLIAGTTGSGKSVAINTMILSLLYKLSPEECRLIMIDPKMLELSVYDGIPHLLSPVVTDPKKAVVALKWVVGEMEERYRKMSKMGVRNIEGYNGRVRETLARGEMFNRTVQTGFDEETGDPIFETEEITPELLPYIVVIVDEMADLMMVAGKEIEACIQRLAQMARASGIHLIMATQRPSVDVITGTIKANFPTRISFQVTGKIDSRTILGEQGAEQLLGQGDMLYMAGGAKITRVHGPFCSDEEVEEIVTYLKQFGPPDYVGGVVDGPDDDKESDIDLVLGLGGNTDGEDALYDQAVAIVIKDRKCSTSYIQRKLAIGYNKAARLVEQMEDEGVVSQANHVGKREILVPEPS